MNLLHLEINTICYHVKRIAHKNINRYSTVIDMTQIFVGKLLSLGTLKKYIQEKYCVLIQCEQSTLFVFNFVSEEHFLLPFFYLKVMNLLLLLLVDHI